MGAERGKTSAGDPGTGNLLKQKELDELLLINGFINDEHGEQHGSLLEEIQAAVLDSGKLSLEGWISLRERLKELERLSPHIDLIIELKRREQGRRATR